MNEKVKCWAWSLEVGGSYLDPRWIISKENILINYQYIRAKDEISNTPMGEIKCKVVNGMATSQYWTTPMETYFKSTTIKNMGSSDLNIQISIKPN